MFYVVFVAFTEFQFYLRYCLSDLRKSSNVRLKRSELCRVLIRYQWLARHQSESLRCNYYWYTQSQWTQETVSDRDDFQHENIFEYRTVIRRLSLHGDFNVFLFICLSGILKKHLCRVEKRLSFIKCYWRFIYETPREFVWLSRLVFFGSWSSRNITVFQFWIDVIHRGYCKANLITLLYGFRRKACTEFTIINCGESDSCRLLRRNIFRIRFVDRMCYSRWRRDCCRILYFFVAFAEKASTAGEEFMYAVWLSLARHDLRDGNGFA